MADLDVKSVFEGCIVLGLTEVQAWGVVQSVWNYSQKPNAERFRDLLESIKFDDPLTSNLIREIIEVWWQKNPPQEVNQMVLNQTVDNVSKNLQLWKEFATTVFKNYGNIPSAKQ